MFQVAKLIYEHPAVKSTIETMKIIISEVADNKQVRLKMYNMAIAEGTYI